MEQSKVLDRDQLIDKMIVDFYFGEDMDHPPITARLRNAENKLKTLDKVFWMALIAFLTMIGDILSHHWSK